MDAINIAASALNTHQAWLNAISNNIANVNTAKSTSGNAFQAEYLEVQDMGGENGVGVAAVAHGSAQGRLVYDPTNAVADKSGYVRMPDIDLGEQMSTLIMAQRGYQANAAVVDRAKTTYEAALQIGRS
jgi:flagellar basal-body rod protein FlgC